MIYLSHARLMLESERAVEGRAASHEEIPGRVCRQLLADGARYHLWRVRHDGHMGSVADRRRRERQLLALRGLSIVQIHRTALVRHLRDNRITGSARDQTLREFYGVMDTTEAAITEHRNYLMAASTQFCASDILELVGDHHGTDLIRCYELAYTQYFGMFCEQSRARSTGTPYLLATLLPEVRGAAQRLRERLMDPERLPAKPAPLQKGGAWRPAPGQAHVRRASLTG